MSKSKEAQKVLDKILETEDNPPPQKPLVASGQKKLGEILIEQGYLTKEQLDYALTKQKTEKQEPLGKILIDNNLINEKTLENILGKNIYTRDKYFQKFYQLANQKNVVLIGKSRVGKTFLLKQYIKGKDIVYFPEPPTPNTLLNTIISDEKIQKLKIDEKVEYIIKQDKTYTIAIDSLENMTTSLSNILIKLISENKIKLLGAGHSLKKKYSKLWMYTDTVHIKPLNYSESKELIDTLGYTDSSETFKSSEAIEAIIKASDGIPGKLIMLCEEAKAGKVPELQKKEFDLAPLMILLIAIGFTARAIGFGLTAMNIYIIGGIAGGLGIVIFYLFRGYQEGWWGSLASKNPPQKRNSFKSLP